MSVLKAALGAAMSAVASDAIVRPRQIGQLARQTADRLGKPLLLVHGSGVLHHLIGPPVRAEAETSRAYPLPHPDRAFGVILAVGALETLKRPDAALQEWRRVADKVFVVVPSWWSPAAWLNPTNRWYIDPALRTAWPIWNDRNRVYLLPLSDSRYAARRWNPNCVTTTSGPRTSSRATAPRQSNPSQPSAVARERQRSPSQTSAPQLASSLGNRPFDSSNSASTLMVVSEQSFDES